MVCSCNSAAPHLDLTHPLHGSTIGPTFRRCYRHCCYIHPTMRFSFQQHHNAQPPNSCVVGSSCQCDETCSCSCTCIPNNTDTSGSSTTTASGSSGTTKSKCTTGLYSLPPSQHDSVIIDVNGVQKVIPLSAYLEAAAQIVPVAVHEIVVSVVVSATS